MASRAKHDKQRLLRQLAFLDDMVDMEPCQLFFSANPARPVLNSDSGLAAPIEILQV
jgi:hypothetical protein